MTPLTPRRTYYHRVWVLMIWIRKKTLIVNTVLYTFCVYREWYIMESNVAIIMTDDISIDCYRRCCHRFCVCIASISSPRCLHCLCWCLHNWEDTDANIFSFEKCFSFILLATKKKMKKNIQNRHTCIDCIAKKAKTNWRNSIRWGQVNGISIKNLFIFKSIASTTCALCILRHQLWKRKVALAPDTIPLTEP